MGNIQQSIVIILASDYALAGEFVVINPNLGRAVDGYNIALSASETELQVAENNVGRTLDAETRVDETCQSCQYHWLKDCWK